MENDLRPIIQTCSVNGKTCRNGKRDDFDTNPITGEKNVCHKWVKLVGPDPQTGNNIDTWCCADFAVIKLLLENALRTRQVTSAIDRNNDVFFSALPAHVQERIMSNKAIPNALANGKTEGADHGL